MQVFCFPLFSTIGRTKTELSTLFYKYLTFLLSTSICLSLENKLINSICPLYFAKIVFNLLRILIQNLQFCVQRFSIWFSGVSVCELRTTFDFFGLLFLFSRFPQTLLAVQGRARSKTLCSKPAGCIYQRLLIAQRRWLCLLSHVTIRVTTNHTSMLYRTLHDPEEEVPITKENLRHKSQNSR